jgi:WD40 repeat protein
MNTVGNVDEQAHSRVLAVDPTQAKIVRELQQARAPGYCHFDQTGKFLYVGSEDNAIQQWNCETGENLTLEGHESWVRGFVFPSAGDLFVSSGYDGELIWWTRNTSPPRVVSRVHAHRGWIRCIALSPDGRWLASGGNDRVVKIWSVSDRKLVGEMTGHQYDVCSLAFHPDGDELVSSDMQCVVKTWKTGTWQPVRELDASSMFFVNKHNRGPSGGLRSLVFSSDGTELIGSGVVGGGDPLGQAVNPGAIVFDWNSGEKLRLLKARGNELGVAWGLVYHPVEQFIAAVSGGMGAKHVYFWRTNEGQPFHVIELPSPGRSIALHPNGQHLAVAMHDGKIQIHRLS